MRIHDYPLTPEPGFRLRAIPLDPQFLDGFAEISTCGEPPTRMTDWDEIDVECTSSASIAVVQGPIEILLNENMEVVVPTDASVFIDDSPDGQTLIQNTSAEGAQRQA